MYVLTWIRTMSVPFDVFVKGLVESGAISASEIARFLQSRPSENWPSGDAQKSARELVRASILTPYQATAIFQGKGLSLNFARYVILDRLCRSSFECCSRPRIANCTARWC